jgi:hypothetical protein
MLTTRHQNAGQNHDKKTANRSFENEAKMKYCGTTVIYQNMIHGKIKSRLMSCNACYRLVQNILSSRLLSKNGKVRIYKTIILPVVLYGSKLGL